MFKRAVMTDEISQDLGRALDVMSRFGMDGAEIRSVWGSLHRSSTTHRWPT